MCKPNYYGDPRKGCRRECEANSDCPIDKVCDNYRCKDPCIGAGCAYNALCTVDNHQSFCRCPDSSTGDPYDECITITTSKIKRYLVEINFLGWYGAVDLLEDALEHIKWLLALLFIPKWALKYDDSLAYHLIGFFTCLHAFHFIHPSHKL